MTTSTSHHCKSLTFHYQNAVKVNFIILKKINKIKQINFESWQVTLGICNMSILKPMIGQFTLLHLSLVISYVHFPIIILPLLYFDFRLFIIVFMTSSLGVVVIYWGWYSYYTYDTDTLVYDDQTGTGLVVTMVFLVLLLPVCLHYRSIELQQDVDTENDRQEDVKIHRHRHERHRHRDRSPPPKYHESKFI